MIPPPPTPTLFPYTTLFRSRSDLSPGGRQQFDRGGIRRQLSRSEEHTSELQSLRHLVCRLLLEKKKKKEKCKNVVEKQISTVRRTKTKAETAQMTEQLMSHT